MARESQDQPDTEDGIRVSRRDCLKLAGASLAVSTPILNEARSPQVPETTEMAVYGYGGQQVFEQQGSITRSAFSGTVQQLTAVSESEPNDEQGTADTVEIGSIVTAELAEAEVDWYAFDADKDQSVVAELDRESADGVTALMLYDSEGKYVDLEYVGTGQPSRVELDPAPSAGTYYVQVVDIQSSAGSYTLTVTEKGNATPTPTPTSTPTATRTETPTPTPTPTPEQRPYYGTVRDGTNRIEAEEYDEGGEGVAYHDTDGTNTGGEYREDGVDIQETTDANGYNVGWIEDGEWLEYTITLPAGAYDFKARVAGWTSDESLRASLDGTELGTVDVPDTGGYQNWTTVTLTGVSVETEGEQILRIEALGGDMNINWTRFVPQTTPTPTPTETPSPTPTPTPTETPLPTVTPTSKFGTQGYGEYGYGGVK